MNDRAQVNTLEGFAAAFIILFAMLFGLQAIATTSPGTLGQEVKTYDEKITNDVLLQSKASGELKTALLNWTREEGFNGSVEDDIFYSGERNSVPGEFGDTLGILEDEGLAYSIDIVCDGTRKPFVRNGDGGQNPVGASVTVILNDDDELRNGTRLDNAVSYPCDDIDEDSNLYNVVEVRMAAWRT